MPKIVETAWAKINLALHITGLREDGYHLLDSVVTFADFGDVLTFRSGERDAFSIDGDFATSLESGDDNLVIRARDRLRQLAQAAGHGAPPVAIHLEKALPVAAGIGGGSADAAACLRGLIRLWRLPEDILERADMAKSLGADVPMCLISRPLIAHGIGDRVSAIENMPEVPVLLVNPQVPVPTGAVFAQLARKDNERLRLPRFDNTVQQLAASIHTMRNDLEDPARALFPVIGEVLAALDTFGPLVRRMSGSGATCFGLFDTVDHARLAGGTLRDKYPGWWIRAGMTRA